MSKTPPVCVRKHCQSLGTRFAVLRVPAIGGKRENALSVPFGVPFCEGHAATANVGEFTAPKVRVKLRKTCRQLGGAKPDFAKAWLEWAVKEWNPLAES